MDFADSPPAAAAAATPFDTEYMGYDPRMESRRFDDSFRMSDFGDEKAGVESDDGYEHVGEVPGFAPDSPSPFHPEPQGDLPSPDVSHEQPSGYNFAPSPVFASANGGAVLPPPEEMEPEEGRILSEWKRQNAIHLQEKERIEKEMLDQIMDEALEFKRNFYHKRSAHVEAQKKSNRDKETVFLSNQEHFHATAEKHYWKAVSELIPTEVPAIETKRGKDKDKKKTTVIFNQGPKPGKATDMSRMRQVLLKLKHNPPAHMKTPPPEAAKTEAAEKKPESAAPTPAVEVAS